MPEISNFESIGKVEKIPVVGQEQPDLKVEKAETSSEKKTEEKGETAAKAAVISASAAIPLITSLDTERQKKIEDFLARGLEDMYLNLPPDKQAEFKKAGEETASKINKLMGKTKVKLKEIVNLIIKWLAIIPGVNKFFLEQEAKIRADQIMRLKK